jgi:hypothetical protein
VTSGPDSNAPSQSEPTAQPPAQPEASVQPQPPVRGKPSASRYFARIIRAVIVSSLGFGGGIGLLTFITILVFKGQQPSAISVALQAGMVLGVGFGFCLALLLLLSDLSGRLYAAKGHHDEIWELEQTREVEIEGPLREVRSRSRIALQRVPAIKSVIDDEDQYHIRGMVGQSWKSPGENMVVSIEAGESENIWRVRCTSSCLNSNIAFDYGKNFENVEAWLRSIQNQEMDSSAINIRAFPKN